MWKIRKNTIRDENVPIRVNLQSIVFQYCAMVILLLDLAPVTTPKWIVIFRQKDLKKLKNNDF